MELELVADGTKIEGLAGCEDDDLLGEIAIVGVVETICLCMIVMVSRISCQLLMKPPWWEEQGSNQPSMKSRMSILTLLGRSL